MATTLEDVDRVLADYRPGPDDPDLTELMRGHLKAAAAEAAEAGHVEPAQPFEVESADESEPPRREWLIPGWLPRGRLASIYGRGEAGKSRLLLHVAHAVACGGPVLPWDPDVKADAVRGDVPQVADVGRVLLVTWEDEAAEVRRRWRMAHAAGAVGTERMPAEIAILDMRRHGAGPLWAPHSKGSGHVSTRGEWTEAGRRILAMLPGCDLAVLDPLASAYACSEIDRALVRGFAARLDAEAEAAGCAVVLSAHPSRAGEREGSAESGSTDWRNAVRSRWILGPQRTAHKAPGADGKDAPIDAPCLALDKASYAPGRGRVWLRSHYRRSDPDKWDELAWFATTGQAAAVAAHVRDGGKAGDVSNIGAEKAARKRGDKSVENPDRAYV